MKYDILKHAKTLELDRVLEMLAAEASMPDAKQMALELTPFDNKTDAARALKETEEAYLMIAKHSAPAFGGSSDISSAVTRAQVGASLSIRELLDVAYVLKTIRKIKTWRGDCSDKNIGIDRLFDALAPNKFLEEKISFAIKKRLILTNTILQSKNFQNVKVKLLLLKII